MNQIITPVVKHLVFGPDGNRRYARERGISYAEAYDIAARKVVDATGWWFKNGHIEELSIWALQEYNLERPREQIGPLTRAVMDCIGYVCKSDVVQNNDLQVRVIGEVDSFLDSFEGDKDELSHYLQTVKNHQGKAVNILTAYNGSKELKRAWGRCEKDGVEPTLQNLSSRWSFSPVSLFIRTGQPDGFNRLSDYYAGCEKARLLSTPKYPADLTSDDFDTMIESFRGLRDSVD